MRNILPGDQIEDWMVMTRSRRDTTDGVVAYTVFVGGSMLVALVAGVFVGLPWQVTLLVSAAAAVTGMVIAAMASSGQRRDTLRWQDAAVAVSAWASRNAGRCETSPHAFGEGTSGEWTLPASPRFSGTILAVAHRQGFEVGVACYEQPYGEGATSRHTALFVRLAATHQRVRLTSRSSRRRSAAGMAEAATRMVAALPARPESVEVQDQELRVVYYGWPGAMDLDARVDASVEVARALREEKA